MGPLGPTGPGWVSPAAGSPAAGVGGRPVGPGFGASLRGPGGVRLRRVVVACGVAPVVVGRGARVVPVGRGEGPRECRGLARDGQRVTISRGVVRSLGPPGWGSPPAVVGFAGWCLSAVWRAWSLGGGAGSVRVGPGGEVLPGHVGIRPRRAVVDRARWVWCAGRSSPSGPVALPALGRGLVPPVGVRLWRGCRARAGLGASGQAKFVLRRVPGNRAALLGGGGEVCSRRPVLAGGGASVAAERGTDTPRAPAGCWLVGDRRLWRPARRSAPGFGRRRRVAGSRTAVLGPGFRPADVAFHCRWRARNHPAPPWPRASRRPSARAGGRPPPCRWPVPVPTALARAGSAGRSRPA